MPAVIGGDGDGGGAQGDACDITVGGHRGDALVAALPADGFIRRAVGLHRGGEELRPGSFDAHGGFVQGNAAGMGPDRHGAASVHLVVQGGGGGDPGRSPARAVTLPFSSTMATPSSSLLQTTSW